MTTTKRLSVLFACTRCGTEFHPIRRRQRFCSVSCGRARNPDRAQSKVRRDLRDRQRPGLNTRQRSRLLARWKRQGRPCAYCGGRADTVDHVVPLVRGGDNYEGNLVPACRACNSAKCDLLLIEWRTTKTSAMTVQRLWRPREIRPKRPQQPTVQQVLGVCYVCGSMHLGPDRRTCGDPHCQREHAGRLVRDKYRAAHGIPVDPTEPTAYWRRLQRTAV